jgi:hypothetical protein
MDECMDGVRSVTDGRYVYLRNYYPHVSQGQHVDFQFQTPTTRIWRAQFDAGKVTPAQAIFWQVPKAPEELYDLQSDPDEVKNLAKSPQHRAILEKLRTAQRAHAAKVRDVCFLPEGEIHARAQGGSPHDMARDDRRYPFQRIFDAADLASGLDASATPRLITLMRDSDSAVRYWGALGLLMRGSDGVSKGQAALRSALQDQSPYVRVVAAQALAQHGAASDSAPALAVLGELAPPEKNGVFVAMASLSAIQALGPKAASLHSVVRAMKPDGPSPDGRFNSYVPRQIANITGVSATPAKEPRQKGRKKTP